MQPSYPAPPAIVISINVAALVIGSAVVIVLTNSHPFHGGPKEWIAIGVGFVAYIAAKILLAFAVGYVWGGQEVKHEIAALAPERIPHDVGRKRKRTYPAIDMVSTAILIVIVALAVIFWIVMLLIQLVMGAPF